MKLDGFQKNRKMNSSEYNLEIQISPNRSNQSHSNPRNQVTSDFRLSLILA